MRLKLLASVAVDDIFFKLIKNLTKESSSVYELGPDLKGLVILL